MTLAELLMAQVSISLYAVATVAFLVAAMKGWRNYQHTKSISNYWLIFTIAVALGAAFTAADLLVSLGVYPDLFDQLDRWIALLFIFSLIMTAVETLTSEITVTIR